MIACIYITLFSFVRRNAIHIVANSAANILKNSLNRQTNQQNGAYYAMFSIKSRNYCPSRLTFGLIPSYKVKCKYKYLLLRLFRSSFCTIFAVCISVITDDIKVSKYVRACYGSTTCRSSTSRRCVPLWYNG